MEALAKAQRKPLCAGNEVWTFLTYAEISAEQAHTEQEGISTDAVEHFHPSGPASRTLQALSVSKGQGMFVHD